MLSQNLWMVLLSMMWVKVQHFKLVPNMRNRAFFSLAVQGGSGMVHIMNNTSYFTLEVTLMCK